jgi:hypothetical protein
MWCCMHRQRQIKHPQSYRLARALGQCAFVKRSPPSAGPLHAAGNSLMLFDRLAHAQNITAGSIRHAALEPCW